MPKVLRIINRLNLGGPTYNTALLTRFLEPEYETMLVSGVKLDFEESSEFIVHKYGIELDYYPHSIFLLMVLLMKSSFLLHQGNLHFYKILFD